MYLADVFNERRLVTRERAVLRALEDLDAVSFQRRQAASRNWFADERHGWAKFERRDGRPLSSASRVGASAASKIFSTNGSPNRPRRDYDIKEATLVWFPRVNSLSQTVLLDAAHKKYFRSCVVGCHEQLCLTSYKWILINVTRTSFVCWWTCLVMQK